MNPLDMLSGKITSFVTKTLLPLFINKVNPLKKDRSQLNEIRKKTEEGELRWTQQPAQAPVSGMNLS